MRPLKAPFFNFSAWNQSSCTSEGRALHTITSLDQNKGWVVDMKRSDIHNVTRLWISTGTTGISELLI